MNKQRQAWVTLTLRACPFNAAYRGGMENARLTHFERLRPSRGGESTVRQMPRAQQYGKRVWIRGAA